jgi:hypothetical protein
MSKNSIENKMKFRRKQTIAVALALILTLSVLGISTTTVDAATNITLQWQSSHQVIGVNQPIVLGIIVSTATFASVYGVTWGQLPTSLVYVWSSAYVVFTRPDGTNVTIHGPFELGVAHRPRFEFTPDMVGTWKAQFVWPGDKFYNPATVTFNFGVQQQPIPKRDVWAFISTRPDTAIGITQNLLINAWITPPPLTGSEVYKGYTFTLTQPDGTNVKIGPMTSEGEGTVWFEYPMTQIGQFTIKFDFAGDIHNKPATISKTITVQKDLVPTGYPENPLPTSEWNFPINTQNRDLRNIAGPWYMVNYNSSKGAWNPYTEAPMSAHILWRADPITGLGGYIGAPHSIQTGGGEEVYGAGDNGIYTASIVSIKTVMAGKGYYIAGSNIICVDMRTGEKLWTTPGSFNVGAERNGVPALYLFGTRFIAYDGLTGAVTLNVTGMAMQANLYDPPYVYSAQNYTRFQYEQTSTGTVPGTEVPTPAPRLIKWTTAGTTTNFTERIIWNVSVPVNELEDGWMVLENGLIVSTDWYSTAIPTYLIWAINATTGQMVYSKTPYDVSNPVTWIYKQGPMTGSGYGKLYFASIPYQNQGQGWVAFDVATGNLAWVSEKTGYPWGLFWAYMPEASGYGMVYGLSYDGVYAFNATNGKINWHFTAVDPYHETPYNQYVFGSVGPIVGGGIVFAPETEHSPTFIYRNQRMNALDALTGKEVWSIEGVYTPTAIAYGILLASDNYNGFTYAFGKGSTETTVSASTKIATRGSPLLIEGTVTDQSPAQKGTPAISDASMSAWMEYLNMQQPKPKNATGVKVHLTALDPNGNTEDLGYSTSDVSGLYSMMWTPPVEGKYTITAAFEGSNSYYASSAETAIGVGAAISPAVVTPVPTQTAAPNTPTPAQTTLPTPSPAIVPPTSGTQTATYIAITAAVIIIAVAAIAAAVFLRRKK